MRNTAILKWIERGDQNVVHKDRVQGPISATCFQTSHILYRKPVLSQLNVSSYLLIVAISEVNSSTYEALCHKSVSQTTEQTHLANHQPFTMWLMHNYNRMPLEQHGFRCITLLNSSEAKKRAIHC